MRAAHFHCEVDVWSKQTRSGDIRELKYDGWVIVGGWRDRCLDLELPQRTRCGEYRERFEVAEEGTRGKGIIGHVFSDSMDGAIWKWSTVPREEVSLFFFWRGR